MLLLHVTDDRGAITVFEAHSFPVVIGRSAQADLQVSSAGVFETHARIDLAASESGRGDRFCIQPLGQALLLVNGEPIQSRRLAIGDEISIGAARMVVSLAPARQPRLGFYEALVWMLLFFVVSVEALVIHFAG